MTKPLRFVRLSDIPAAKVPVVGDSWGKWRLTANKCLEFRGGYGYEIDLESIQTEYDAFDWVLHMSNKGWIEPQDLGDLTMALKAVFPKMLELR